MHELVVNAPGNKRVVTDYDFICLSGLVLPVSVEPALGDTIEFSPDEITIYLAPRPNSDGKTLTPAENLILYKRNIISYQFRTKEVEALTPEQKAEWNKTIQEAGGVVN